ncbi:hypothetical protein CBS101457_006848 [Exobasidium rhododendri]|nr:hypothetical protein CBS101457_006848 [Exobasidium rhododendri]
MDASRTSELNEQYTDEAMASLENHAVNEPPPSPPPSTHSSEDLLSSILPSYFYPQTAGAESIPGSSVSSDDEVPGIPVFEPTWEEFKDFYTFCQRIDEWGMKSGIVKIIPPKEWTDSLPRLDGRQGSTSSSSKQASSGERYTDANPLSQVRIKNSIEQIFTPAGSGSWRQSNVVHPARVSNAKQWADLCAIAGQRGPELSRMKDNAKRGGEDAAEEDGVRTRSGRGNKATAVVSKSQTSAKRKRTSEGERSIEGSVKAELVEESKDSPTEDAMPALEEGEASKAMTNHKTKIADRTTQQEWDDFDYVQGWCKETGQNAEPSDWNPSVCKAIESEYWRGLNFGKAPMYGADLKGTLFTSATRHWNVGVLDNILTRLRLRRKLPGVTTPYLYFGMWRATFAWHVEDMDLYSINYVHFGAPKQWYSIRQSDRQRFELAMAGAFPGDSSRCKHFMRHKSYLASPAFLASAAGVKPLRLVQKAQEFVITYPYGYHSGFNLGYNCAESVNFALESWLDIGRKAGYCDCANDSVKMDVDAMIEESKEMEELDRKKEERERKKESDEKVLKSEEERQELRRARERERRRIRKEEQARLEALGIYAPSSQEISGEGAVDPTAHVAKKAKVQGSVCIFCPSVLEEDLVVVPYTTEELDKNSKRSTRRAHRICASFVPETWIGANSNWKKGNHEPEEIVMGFEGIAKARWSLKCQNCVDPSMSKKGAKVQCTYGKCFRTSHVSCALQIASGWMLDVLTDNKEADELEGKGRATKKDGGGKQGSMEKDEVAPSSTSNREEGDDEGGEEETRIVILCKSHNPREKEREARRKIEVMRRCITKIIVGQAVKVRTSSGLWETRLRGIVWPEAESGEGEIVVEDEQRIKWTKILFDPEVVKKAEEEQYEQEEEIRQKEEAVAEKAEEAVSFAAAKKEDMPEKKKKDPQPLTAEEEARLQMKAEAAEQKSLAKAAEVEAKEASRRIKEEGKRAKEAIKVKKSEEKAAKAVQREEKVKAKEQRKAAKEEKVAIKRAKAEGSEARKAALDGQRSELTVAHGPAPAVHDYSYIRDWQPQARQFSSLPRPNLPQQANELTNRQLPPLWQDAAAGNTGASFSGLASLASTAGGYPAHLATLQNRTQQSLSSYHLAPLQHQQQQPSRTLTCLPNNQYASQYLPPQASRPGYSYYQPTPQQLAHAPLHAPYHSQLYHQSNQSKYSWPSRYDRHDQEFADAGQTFPSSAGMRQPLSQNDGHRQIPASLPRPAVPSQYNYKASEQSRTACHQHPSNQSPSETS